MLDLTITAPNGTTKATLTAETAQYRRTLTGEQASGQATVARSDWRAAGISLNRRDRVTVTRGTDTIVDGLFADTDTDGTTVTITVDSPERAGADAEPTGVVSRRVSDSDQSIVNDVINAVPAWSAGTVEQLSTDVTLSFSLAARDKQLRDVQEVTGGELDFSGFSVDYVDRLGTDRSETLSPGSGYAVDGLRVVAEEGSQATHVAVIGSLDSPDTQVALVAPQSDGRDFEGDGDWTSVVRYASPDWSSNADDAWRRYGQQESVETDRLSDIADQVATRLESETRTLTVETSIVGLDVTLGDRFPVSYAERGIDRELRVIKLTHVVDRDGERTEVVLSNRTPVRDTGDRRRRRTLDTLASGYQGFVDRSPGIGAGNWQLVEDAGGSRVRASLPVRKPDDVLDELDVTLDVEGRAWRSPVALQTTSDPVGGVDQAEVFALSGTETNVSFQDNPPALLASEPMTSSNGDPISGWPYVFTASAGIEAIGSGEFRQTELLIRVPSLPDSPEYSLHTTTDVPTRGYKRLSGATVVTRDLAGEDIELRIIASYPNNSSQNITWGLNSYAVDPHAHATSFEPSVVDEFEGTSYYPRGDIFVNGNLVAGDVGTSTGSWFESVDLSGQLVAGRNDIEYIPLFDTRGEVQLSLSTEYIRTGDSA